MGGTSIWMSSLDTSSKYSRLVRSGTDRWNDIHQARCWVLRERLRRTSDRGPVAAFHGERQDTRPYLENCTVDASILLVFGPALISARSKDRTELPK